MKKRAALFLILFLIVMLTASVLGITILLVPPKTISIETEVTFAKSVTESIGDVEYTFRIYPYDQAGVYVLRVESKNEFETHAVVKGQTYQILDLEVYVKELTSGRILIKVKRI